eukprot:m.348405 g.348405  ORF g.348405 m.348405 type:complete len:145 (-) comp37136_c0_seq1:1-435(-)
MTVKQAGFLNNDVVTFSTEESAAEALHVMAEKKVSGLPVVDEHGVLITNFSSTDLRGVRDGDIPHLLLPVVEFLKLEHLHAPRKKDIETLDVPVTCEEDYKMSSVLKRMTSAKVHRMYVVDKKQKVVGVVTHTDILRLLYKHTS